MTAFLESHPWISFSILVLLAYAFDSLLVSLRDAKFPEMRRRK